MSALKMVVFSGSVRSQRQGIRAARFVMNKCREGGHEAVLFDPQEFALPLLDKMYKEYAPGSAPALLQRLADLVIPADAYVVVSGEYNHGVPPALANLLDHFLEEYFRKPSAIVSYSAGSFGGSAPPWSSAPCSPRWACRASPRPCRSRPCRSAFDDAGTPTDPRFHKRADRFFEELEWYATALRDARPRPARAAIGHAALVLK
jgi:NAD(P)H-dependent FMN reductase